MSYKKRRFERRVAWHLKKEMPELKKEEIDKIAPEVAKKIALSSDIMTKSIFAGILIAAVIGIFFGHPLLISVIMIAAVIGLFISHLLLVSPKHVKNIYSSLTQNRSI